MVGHNSRMDSRQIIATSGLTKSQKHVLSCYFLSIGGGSHKSRWFPLYSKQSIPGPFYQKTKSFEVVAISQKIFCVGGLFWKYKPPGGLPGTNPGFLETQILAKSQGLKTSWSCFVICSKFVERSSNSVALTFRCGFRQNSPGIDCWEKWGDH